MPALLPTLVLVAVSLLAIDLSLPGGAMTMAGLSAMATIIGHPMTAGALAVLIVALVASS